jgi:bifunctional non-homologous end joining protein LigD
MNCIDMNAWYSRVDKPHRPDFVLFDLDPPDGGFPLAIRVAHLIREELEASSWSRTSRRAAPTGFTCSSRLRAERATR